MGTARSWSENHGENKLKSWGDLRPVAHRLSKVIKSRCTTGAPYELGGYPANRLNSSITFPEK